jgi:hypothetical protein
MDLTGMPRVVVYCVLFTVDCSTGVYLVVVVVVVTACSH